MVKNSFVKKKDDYCGLDIHSSAFISQPSSKEERKKSEEFDVSNNRSNFHDCIPGDETRNDVIGDIKKFTFPKKRPMRR